MPALFSRLIFALVAAAWLSTTTFGGITKNADQSSYDFFYYEESLLDLVNDVRRLSAKNILFRPNELKEVNISFGREQVELITTFSEALEIYGFGFEKMADTIYMIKRVRSVEDVAEALQTDNVLVGGTESSSSAEAIAEAYKELVSTDEVQGVVALELPALILSSGAASVDRPVELAVVSERTMVKQVVSRLESPEFVKAVAGFQRRYIEALMTEGFTKEEAMKMALGFNPVSLVPSEEIPPRP